MRIRLATRGSVLAWTQSGHVADALRARGHEVELVRITTHGDVSAAPLVSLGGVGVFVGAVREAVLDGRADIAVHSLKDLPTPPAPGLLLAAVPLREDPADALCTRDGGPLSALRVGARVGTGSPRRAAQLLALRPDLEVLAIRGNVETRLARVDDDLDAVVLAAAGLRRLGLADRIAQRLEWPDFLPAPAQGALAVECREDAPSELIAALGEVDDRDSRLAALAERAVLARLEAGCAAPVAAYAVVDGEALSLVAVVVAPDGSRRLTATGRGDLDPAAAAAVGEAVADALLADGAADLVDLAAGSAPLTGRTVLVPSRSPDGLVGRLTADGAHVVGGEFTRIESLPDSALDAAFQAGFDWLVVTSANALPALAGRSLPRGARIAAVGPATASALVAAGFGVDLVGHGGGRELAVALGGGPGHALLPGPRRRSPEPAKTLAASGWKVSIVDVYETVAVPPTDELAATWRSADAVVVTAGSMARAGVEGCGLPQGSIIAIGDTTAAACREAGLAVAAIATHPDAAAVRDAVVTALTAPAAVRGEA